MYSSGRVGRVGGVTASVFFTGVCDDVGRAGPSGSVAGGGFFGSRKLGWLWCVVIGGAGEVLVS